MIKKEMNYQFRERFSTVHKKDRRNPEKTCPKGSVEITSNWWITVPGDADAVLMNAARDLADYFLTSMKIKLRIATDGDGFTPFNSIAYGIDETVKEHSYRFTVKKNKVTLLGHDSRMAAQAGYFIEDLMNLTEAPFLEITDTVRTSLFNPRMVHSGYGLDMYPDEHLINIAHLGISAILVFVKGIDTTPHGHQDFNELCRRAGEYGLDVYAYSYLENKLHPGDEGAEEFYDNLYGKLFEHCPHFKGMIFVGESCEFPSKDEHTMMVRRKDNRDKDGKPIKPWTKPYPGWWPCFDYPELFNLIKKVIRKHRTDADVVFWSYGWDNVGIDDKRALMEALPKDISFQSTFEMDETVIRDGVANYTVDYTLFFPGPGYSFSTEARLARDNSLNLYAMTNAGGLTWDIGVVPYIPAPYQWMKRFYEMRHAHTTYGLSGTMDSHHFGVCPSFISELAKWAFHTPYENLDDVLHKLVERDFSSEVADDVCEAYRLFSDGIFHLISTEPDQYGPCRIGPSYPLILFDHEDVQIPTVPYAHFGGNKITFPVYGNSSYLAAFDILSTEKKREKFDYEIKSFKLADELYTKGCKLLQQQISAIPERKKEDAERILALCTFIRNTIRTAINVKEFYKLKCSLLDKKGKERNSAVDEMLAIAKREELNALDTIPLVEFDSRLGYEPSMEYMTDRAHIEWKLGLLSELIEKELPSYYEK